MKYRVLIIALFLSFSAFAQVDLSKGLQAYYKFNGDAKDYSGFGNDATTINGPSLATDRFENSNSCYNFSNSNHYIDVPHHSSLNPTGGLTVSAWVNINAFNASSPPVSDIVKKGYDDNAIGRYILRYGKNLSTGETYAYFTLRFANNTADAVYAKTTTQLKTGEWYLFTGTYDGSEIRFYINGELQESKVVNKTLGTNNDQLRIGRNIDPSWPYPVTGKIDDVRIYNRALSQLEVTALYNLPDEQNLPGKLSGTLYTDNNNDCEFNAGDEPQANMVVIAEPGPYYSITDIDGNYSINVPKGNYTVKPIVNKRKTQYVTFKCPASGIVGASITTSGEEVSGLNIGVEVEECAIMTVDIQSDRRRRCFDNNTYVKYCNDGFADAENVKIFVQMPEHLSVKSASEPFTAQGNGLLLFDVGTVKVGECKTIKIIDHVDCGDESIRGKTVCTKAWITPKNSCFGPDAGWDKSDIVVKAKCIGDSLVRFVLCNLGDGDMTDSLEFRLFADASFAFKHNYKIKKGDSLEIELSPNGYTIRLEADQHKKHPYQKWVAAFIEGCNVTRDISMDEAPMMFPTDDEAEEVSVHCMEIRDSYDPNDKRVIPAGITAQNIVRPNVPLHYKIRFQNTGNDTAYKVVIVDTLPLGLDISTLQIGASSHKYTYTVTGKERPILTFTFDDIYLPDSFINEPASNGFIKFKIRPDENLLLGSKIENFGDIYFDFNSPVRTNTTLTTIDIFMNEDFTLLDTVRVGNKKVSIFKLPYNTINVKAYPNPATDRLTVVVENLQQKDVTVTIVDLNGKTILQQTSMVEGQRSKLVLDVSELATGVYFVRVSSADKVTTLKLIVN